MPDSDRPECIQHAAELATFGKVLESITATIDDIKADTKALRERVLGNGTPGALYELTRRADRSEDSIAALRDRIEKVEAVKANKSSITKLPSIDKPDGNGARIKGVLADVPPWGWVLIAATLGPDGVQAVVSAITNFMK